MIKKLILRKAVRVFQRLHSFASELAGIDAPATNCVIAWLRKRV